MLSRQSGSLRYLQFNSLARPEISHAIFTRHGGVSPSPWAELNFGRSVGDDLDRVRRNHALALTALDRDPGSVFDAWQVHSSTPIVARRPRSVDPAPRGDILVTGERRVTLVMRFADCVPVFLFDPVHSVIALVHAGWKGTVDQASRIAVQTLVDEFGSRTPDLVAGIGPSIGPDHYVIGTDVADAFRASFGNDADRHLIQADGQLRLDLWAANEHLLKLQGVRSVEVSGICTACHTQDWYSHRAEQGRTGRFGAVFGLG
jgi:YfiH family protein